VAGANPQTRKYTRTRQFGTCKGCGRTRLGSTTIEMRPWADPAEYVYHWCDECVTESPERPLEDVILGFADGD
jgi:hypothetical protein